MAIFNFFKTAQHQKFNIHTRYYDPVKEDVLKRVEELEDMQGSDTEALKKRMAYKMKRRGDGELRRTIRQKAMRKHFMRMSVLIIVLLLITSLIFVQYLPKLTQMMETNTMLN